MEPHPDPMSVMALLQSTRILLPGIIANIAYLLLSQMQRAHFCRVITLSCVVFYLVTGLLIPI